MTKKMDMVSSPGLMEEDMKETGAMVNNPEKEFISDKTTNVKKENGLMEKDLDG